MSEKILIIEDEAAIAKGLAFCLSREGFRTVIAADARTGWDLLEQAAPDLLLLDLMLPDMDGVDLCRALRKESDIPIVVLTARDREDDKVRGLDAGADDYITKPFSTMELIARVKAALRRTRAASLATQRIVAGPVIIDRDTRIVTVNGMPINLRRREFDLLCTLAAPPGRVRTREDLLDTVWADRGFIEEGTLDVHIRRLREKVEADAGQPRHILTIRGIGYKFEV